MKLLRPILSVLPLVSASLPNCNDVIPRMRVELEAEEDKAVATYDGIDGLIAWHEQADPQNGQFDKDLGLRLTKIPPGPRKDSVIASLGDGRSLVSAKPNLMNFNKEAEAARLDMIKELLGTQWWDSKIHEIARKAKLALQVSKEKHHVSEADFTNEKTSLETYIISFKRKIKCQYPKADSQLNLDEETIQFERRPALLYAVPPNIHPF